MILKLLIIIPGLNVALCGNFFRKDYTYNEEHDAYYKAIWSEDGNDFEYAFVACYKDGSRLFYPIDNGEWKIIKSLVEAWPTTPNTTDVLLGIRDEVGKGQYLSVDGDVATLSNIHQDALLHQDCVLMDWSTGTFKATSCKVQNSSRLFVCKKINDRPCPTIDKGYIYNNYTKKCYKVHPIRETWKDALQTCFMEGGLLVVIESDLEADIINKILPYSKDEQMFSAGFRLITDNYYTLKGIKLEDSFIRWLPYDNDMPEEVDDLPRHPHAAYWECGVLRKGTDLYTSSTHCNTHNPFICEIQARF